MEARMMTCSDFWAHVGIPQWGEAVAAYWRRWAGDSTVGSRVPSDAWWRKTLRHASARGR